MALKEKFSRPKNRAEKFIHSKRALKEGNEIYVYARSMQTATATVLHSFFDLSKALEAKLMKVCIGQ